MELSNGQYGELQSYRGLRMLHVRGETLLLAASWMVPVAMANA